MVEVERPRSINARIREKQFESVLTKQDRRDREAKEQSQKEWRQEVLDEHEKSSERSRNASEKATYERQKSCERIREVKEMK